MRNALRATFALLAAGVIGCGPGQAPRHPVHGVITLNGDPYPDATVHFMPEPSNEALAEAEDVTGADGGYKVISMGRPGLPVGKYKVIVTPRPTDEEAADLAKYEDEEQRRATLESLGVKAAKQRIKKAERPTGEFPTEVVAGDNVLKFDVKTKAAK